MLQTTRQHDIVGALKILIKEAGKAFEKRVHLFGAVYTDKAKRCAMAVALMAMDKLLLKSAS